MKIALSTRYKKKLGIEEERPVSWLELEDKAKGLRFTVRVPLARGLELEVGSGLGLGLGLAFLLS